MSSPWGIKVGGCWLLCLRGREPTRVVWWLFLKCQRISDLCLIHQDRRGHFTNSSPKTQSALPSVMPFPWQLPNIKPQWEEPDQGGGCAGCGWG